VGDIFCKIISFLAGAVRSSSGLRWSFTNEPSKSGPLKLPATLIL